MKELSTETLLRKLQSRHLAIERYMLMGNEALERIAIEEKAAIVAELKRRES